MAIDYTGVARVIDCTAVARVTVLLLNFLFSEPDGTQESASPREATSPDILVTNSAAYSQQSKSGDDSLDSPLPITAIEFEPSAQESMISAVRRRSRLSIASITSGVTRQFRKSMELANEETIELINTTEKERIASSTESSKPAHYVGSTVVSR